MLEYFYERIKHPLPDQKDKLGKLTGLSKRELTVSLFFYQVHVIKEIIKVYFFLLKVNTLI